MYYHVVFYSPDRHILYDGRTPNNKGVGGGITARVQMATALAAQGHIVIAYVNCETEITYEGVRYVPLDQLQHIDCDVLIAISTVGNGTFAPLRHIPVKASLKIVWVQGVPQPAAIEVVDPDYLYVASNFLRNVCIKRWNVSPEKLFVCYNGIQQNDFIQAERNEIQRDPFALAYIAPPEKGLDAAIQVVRRLRQHDKRYHLDVFGGDLLWGKVNSGVPAEPGVTFKGMLGQQALIPQLFHYEYCLSLQAIEEGFGIAVQEAKRAGMIVFASAVGAFSELISSSQDGYLIHQSHDSAEAYEHVANLILHLAYDPARRERLRGNAMQTPWSWLVAAQTWTAHWDHLFKHSVAATVTGKAGELLLQLPDGLHAENNGNYFPTIYAFSPLLDSIDGGNHILIAGYFGFGNIGDEAILQSMLEQLRLLIPRLRVTVVSGAPSQTQHAFDVDAVHWRDVSAILNVAQQSDLILLGGGGLFQDYWGVDEATLLTNEHWGLTFFGTISVFATLLHKPFMLYAVGVGPLFTKQGKTWTRRIFQAATKQTVRDKESQRLIEQLGLNAPIVTADPAFLLNSASSEHVQKQLQQAGLSPSDRPILGVALREWSMSGNEWMPQIAQALDHFAATYNATILFIPFQSISNPADDVDDRRVARHIRQHMQYASQAVLLDSTYSPAEIQGLLGACDLVLAMRLHAVILSANVQVPTVALVYDDKVRQAMRQLGSEEYAVDLKTITTQVLSQKLDDAYQDRSTLQQQLQKVMPTLREAAAHTATLAADLLQEKPPSLATTSAEMNTLIGSTLLRQVRKAEQYSAQLKETEKQLEAMRSTRFWRSATTFWRLRDKAKATARAPLKAGVRVARATYHASVPTDRRLAFRGYRSRLLMNWIVYKFDRFKRARIAAYGAHFDKLRVPGEPSLVSIVLPAYNGAPMIGEALDSILNQTYANFELIIVNDGSTDQTPQIVDEYARRDKRIRAIHQENKKLPRTLSRGFQEARGEFLTWTSCDNRLRPDFLAKMVACLQRHPCWDMIYANIDLIDEAGNYLVNTPYYAGYQRPYPSEHVYLPETTGELNDWANNSVGAAFMYRSRAAYLLGDYSPHRFVLEDYDYWMRMNALLTLRHADFTEPVYEYRFHGASLTSQWEGAETLRRRDQMMIFDDFRRDFYLAPLIWVIDAPNVAASLQPSLQKAGHLLYAGEYSLSDLPKLWTPIVYIGNTAGSAPPEHLPDNTFKVLVTSHPVADGIHDAWDICITLGDSEPLPRLSQPYRGWLNAADVSTLFRVIDVRAKLHHLERIETLAEAPSESALKSSVVICTNRSNHQVIEAIRSLAQQTMPREQYEVLVVNNDPLHHPLDGMIEQLRLEYFRDCPDHLRLLVCPIPGLSPARNASLAEARGEIVAFIDDDAVASENWLQQLYTAFDEHPEAGVIGGHITLDTAHLSSRPRPLQPGWERNWSQIVTPYERYTEVQPWWEFPWGANWAARRSALLQVGGFRSQYGRRGNNYGGGEEVVTATLIQRLGYKIAILPTAQVLHKVEGKRFTFQHVRRTLRTGQLVNYFGQRDLYYPRQTSLKRTLRNLLRLEFDTTLRAPLPIRVLDLLYRKEAQFHLLFEQLGDVVKRKRKAVVNTSACDEA